MRWARNIGADYIECDLQKTKDGVILALHDESLLRTTDVEVVYPSRQNDYVSAFTYDELLKLDIGSWFNEANPEQARSSFVGLDILTLDDVLMIAEGYRIKRDANGKRIVNRDENGSISALSMSQTHTTTATVRVSISRQRLLTCLQAWRKHCAHA